MWMVVASRALELQVQTLKPFRVRYAPAPLGAARRFRASLDATTTLQRYRDRLAPAVADHAAALIGPPVPTTPGLRLLIQRGIATHVT